MTNWFGMLKDFAILHIFIGIWVGAIVTVSKGLAVLF